MPREDRDVVEVIDGDDEGDVRDALLGGVINKDTLVGAESGKGGFFSSAFTIFNSTVGTGILTLPYSFRMAGAGLGLFLLLFYALVLGMSAYAVVRCASKMHCKTFQEVVRKILGEKAGIAMSITVAVYCYLVCIGCLVIVADVSKPMLDHWSDSSGSGSEPWWDSRTVAVIVGGIFALPPMGLRDFTSLTFTAIISFCAIVYVVCVIFAEGYNHTSGSVSGVMPGPNETLTPIEAFPPQEASGDVDWGPEQGYKLLYAIPNIALSLQCHIQSPGIFSELPSKRRTPEYFSKVLMFSYLLCISLYSLCAFFGYVTFRNHTPPNIMSGGYDETNPAIIIARISLVLVAICALPINHHPCRAALRDLYLRWQARAEDGDDFDDDGAHAIQPVEGSRRKSGVSGSVASMFEQDVLPRDRFYFTELLVSWATMMGLAMVVPDLSVLNDIIGFTAGVSVMFIFPGLFLLTMQAGDDRLLATHPRLYRAFGYFFVIFGVASGIIAAFSCFDSIMS